MRAIVAGLLLVANWSPSLLGQTKDSALERIELGLHRPPSVFGRFDPMDSGQFDPVASPTPTTFGIFTLVPPTGRGEMIRVAVPIGEIVSRLFNAHSAARRRRQEAAVRREVEAELRWFKEQQRKSHE